MGFGGKHVCLGYLRIFAQFSHMWMLHDCTCQAVRNASFVGDHRFFFDDPKGLLASARQAAKRQVERELIAQIQSYAKESDCIAIDDDYI